MFHTLSIGIIVATLLLIGWIAFTFVRAWTVETGSFWQRTLKAGQRSATIVWAKLVMMVGGAWRCWTGLQTLPAINRLRHRSSNTQPHSWWVCH